jgi:large subunit ribosomal protein L31
MKQAIHPKYYDDCKISCTCGNKFTTRSVVKKIDVEICSKCHPFYTGQQRFVDSKGRIDKFIEKVAKSKGYTKKIKKKKKKVIAKKSDK